MALSLFWLCWNDSANDKKHNFQRQAGNSLQRKFERRRPLMHASAYYTPCRGDDPRAAVAKNGVCRSWATHIHTVPQRELVYSCGKKDIQSATFMLLMLCLHLVSHALFLFDLTDTRKTRWTTTANIARIRIQYSQPNFFPF